jgi:cytochrome b pre-mRNA-processing protein 3
MLSFLFRGLTAEPKRGAALFEALTARARQEHWYRDGAVPDTIDGRFRVLATVTALAIVRLEGDGVEGEEASVAATERFIEVMETEHRELGLGDPTLGRKVQKLVGSLAGRVELWRAATGPGGDWPAAVRRSLYQDGAGAAAIEHSGRALAAFWETVQRTAVATIAAGEIDER